MQTLDPLFNMFAVPFSVQLNSAPDQYKKELLYLQNDRILKEKYRTAENIVQFYEVLPRDRFPEFSKLVCRVTSMFGKTYLCESAFSLMKLTKSRARASLSDELLTASLRLMCTNLIPNFVELSKRKNKS